MCEILPAFGPLFHKKIFTKDIIGLIVKLNYTWVLRNWVQSSGCIERQNYIDYINVNCTFSKISENTF
jgi:hypothetical protein